MRVTVDVRDKAGHRIGSITFTTSDIITHAELTGTERLIYDQLIAAGHGITQIASFQHNARKLEERAQRERTPLPATEAA